MKYIRTNEGIFEVEKEELGFYCCKGLEMAVAPYDKDFVSQADNIKELCDVAVYVAKKYYNAYQKYEIGDVESLQYNKNNNLLSAVYGAIWVIDDNGVPILKPVAKANENGEFELI